jgi:hypothetical protein
MKNLIDYWPNLARAYEVALLGNFTIQIVFKKDYIQGFDDYECIKQFYKNIKFVKKGDLVVEIYKPDYRIEIESETLQDIHNRVKKAKNNSKPSLKLQNESIQLLNTATDKLSYSLSVRQKVIEIAQVIAQLENSQIKPYHIAEAIQYQMNDSEVCNAEEKTINFGKGIKISLLELENTNIENAIAYLQTLI